MCFNDVCFIVSLSRFTFFIFSWTFSKDVVNILMAFLSTPGMIYFFIKSNEILILCKTVRRDYSMQTADCVYANKIPMNA